MLLNSVRMAYSCMGITPESCYIEIKVCLTIIVIFIYYFTYAFIYFLFCRDIWRKGIVGIVKCATFFLDNENGKGHFRLNQVFYLTETECFLLIK